jgi:alpha-glucosidase (family GH31 glycosyl hydrolase)
MLCDAIWLDIEYTEGKRYFTWDKKQFPNPRLMFDKLLEQGRNLITIIDPHLMVDEDYFVYS